MACTKLVLVLDLDHTLLNSVSFQNVGDEERSYLQSFHAFEENAALLHELDDLKVWTKFRPFAFEFVREASKMFDMQIYTTGSRAYAERIAKLLDPTGAMFKDKIISTRDSSRNSKDLEVVSGANQSTTLIVDDSPEVWPGEQNRNLIQVPRYHFFRWSCSDCGLPESSSHSSTKEDEKLGVLANVLSGLQRIHSQFHQNGGDVRDMVAEFRDQVFSGCRIVLSSITTRNVQQHLRAQCEALGGECVTALDDSVTHIVTVDPGSTEAEWGTHHAKFVVHPAWVKAAERFRMCRPHEREFSWRTACVA